jgi:hypothetical protein
MQLELIILSPMEYSQLNQLLHKKNLSLHYYDRLSQVSLYPGTSLLEPVVHHHHHSGFNFQALFLGGAMHSTAEFFFFLENLPDAFLTLLPDFLVLYLQFQWPDDDFIIIIKSSAYDL